MCKLNKLKSQKRYTVWWFPSSSLQTVNLIPLSPLIPIRYKWNTNNVNTPMKGTNHDSYMEPFFYTNDTPKEYEPGLYISTSKLSIYLLYATRNGALWIPFQAGARTLPFLVLSLHIFSFQWTRKLVYKWTNPHPRLWTRRKKVWTYSHLHSRIYFDIPPNEDAGHEEKHWASPSWVVWTPLQTQKLLTQLTG